MQDYNFLWNIGAEDDTDEYFFTSVQDAPRTAITTGSNDEEDSAQADQNLQADRWYSLTSVLDGEAGTISLYVDGEPGDVQREGARHADENRKGEHTSESQSREQLRCRHLFARKKK